MAKGSFYEDLHGKDSQDERKLIQPYQHDCERCIWVSWFSQVPNKDGNMYFCPGTKPGEGSVIIRWSDEPSDYWSAPVGALVKGSCSVLSGTRQKRKGGD